MKAHGIVHKYGDNVDTDVIIPARYLNTASHKELAAHCMEDIDADFVKNVKEGDIIVAEKNFGCGSSREHAPIAIEAAHEIKNGDEIDIDFDTGVITNVTTGKTYQAEPFPEFIQNIIKDGGLINHVTKK